MFNKDDIELVRQFQRSPIYFVEKMWHLTPQPVKDGFREHVAIRVRNGLWKEIGPQHFEPFVKGKHITWQQWLILLAVERGLRYESPRKISVVSGHGTCKTTTLSWLIIWFLFCFKNAQSGVTAPTSEQLHDVLWKEIKLWLDRMPKFVADLYGWQTGYLRINESPETWFARARTARKEAPEAMAGLHGDHVLLAADEASGIDDVIYRSAEGSLTGPNTVVLLISNGTRNLGYFYDTHHSDAQHWQTLAFDSEQSPMVDKAFVDRIEQRYGRNSDEFKIRVSGGFPASEQMDDSGYIPLLTDRDLRQVSNGIPFVGRRFMGVDPSGEGDDMTTWCIRDRFQSRIVATEQTSNDKGIARRTLELMKEYEVKAHDVTVWNFGIGANVRAECLLMDHSADINALNEGEQAGDDIYLNLRAEVAFRARAWHITGGAVVGDELKRDMLGYAYANNLAGRKKIMAKPDLRKRMGRSPDRGDAHLATFAVDYSTDHHQDEDREEENTPSTGSIHDAL